MAICATAARPRNSASFLLTAIGAVLPHWKLSNLLIIHQVLASEIVFVCQSFGKNKAVLYLLQGIARVQKSAQTAAKQLAGVEL